MQHADVHRKHIPDLPGVYVFQQKRRGVLYIWKAKNLKKRLQQYFTPWSVWKQEMVAKAHSINFYTVPSEEDAILLETQLINTHKPPFNNLIKGHNAYVYIKIPREDFPNIITTRYKYNDKARYIGPKVHTKDLKKTMRILRSLLQRRQCSKQQFNQGVVCTDYFFHQCAGRCVFKDKGEKGQQTATENILPSRGTGQKSTIQKLQLSRDTDHAAAKAAYKRMLSLFVDFLEGKRDTLLKHILQEIEQAASQENYERAAKLRDMYTTLEQITQRQHIILPQEYSGTYATMTPIEQGHLIVVITLQQGRLIDIITTVDEHDHTPEEIVQMIQREYGIHLQEKHDQRETYTTYQMWSVAHPIDTETQQHLYQHAIQFGDSYLQTYTAHAAESRAYLLSHLQDTYQLQRLPQRIECVDISHHSGEATSWWLACLMHGYPHKSGYRKYTIQQKNGQDDLASLAELFVRRFQCGTPQIPTDLPDLFIIDGWRTHIQLVAQVLQLFPDDLPYLQQIQFGSIGKGKARKRGGKKEGHHEIFYLLRPDGHIDQYPLEYTAANRLLIQVRDEAHRFANAHRTQRMDQQRSRAKRTRKN